MSKYYEIDENDSRLTDIEKQGDQMLSGYEADMDKAMDANKSALDGINANLEKGQAKLEASANAQTEFAIDEIERQKANAKKDYIKEQSGAYKDYQEQVDPYGVNAEKIASAGLDGTGYAESSKVRMYNQYQARVTAARESFQRSIDNYNASITQARLQNNATLAQIAYETLVKQAEYAATFAMKNVELLTQMAGQKVAIKQQNQQNYMSVYQQLIQEAQFDANMAEEQRQYNESMAENKRQFNETMAFQREQFDWQKQKAAASSSGGSSGGSGRITKSGGKKSSSSGASAINKDDTGSKSTVSKKTTSKETKEPTVDMNSVLKLGLGPISAKRLDSLVSSNRVKEYEQNGKLKYKWQFGGRGTTNGKVTTFKTANKNK